ncbi:hypothetical protein NP493_161g02003 [Ridgeia piscesae]|uniref:tRNA (adenine(58)-N(1))-methyltransferase catalytic subunit TRMT61A n=1 Tax=Ridgeia piscesae TaxID=27915 RepID=A0AAD9UFI8_RIDPI|nr:hypothetical protein NP493_161g02003 [Ridgeia piscesae]
MKRIPVVDTSCIHAGTMSFAKYKKTIEVGDTAILLLGYDNMLQLMIEKDKIYQTKYGALRCNELIGTRYGRRVQCSKGWLYVLHATPELWTVTLPHRTQILYATDISMIVFQLDLKPGSVVIESGTGSGSLSHAILRSVAPSGYLHTFDFHAQRVEKARQEFEEHGLGHLVSVAERDTCKNGFGLECVADAVFLDLPGPWDVLPFAKQAFKAEGGRICSFSPCIEQVQRTCETLEKLGFTDIQSLECLARTFDVRTVNMPLANLGGGVDIGVEGDQSGSLHQPCIGHIEYDTGGRDAKNTKKRRGDGDTPDGSTEDGASKKWSDGGNGGDAGDGRTKMSESASFVFKTAHPPVQMPGHTGFLTFATLYPD